MNKIDKIQQICTNMSTHYVKGEVTWYQDMPSFSFIIFIDNMGIRFAHIIDEEMLNKDNWLTSAIKDIILDYELWINNQFFKRVV